MLTILQMGVSMSRKFVTKWNDDDFEKEGNGSADNHLPLGTTREMLALPKKCYQKETGTTQHDLFIVSNSEK